MTLAIRASAAGLALAAAWSCGGPDAEPHAGSVDTGLSIHQAVAVEPVLDDVAAVYLTIQNRGADEDTLVAVQSVSAGRAEIHDQVRDGEMVHMSPREFVVVPPDDEVILAPGGLHVMLLELREPPVAGDTIVIDFRFVRGGTRTVRVPVVSYADLP